MLLSVRSDRSLIRAAGGSTRHALVEITAPEAPPRTSRPPVNVALVLDRSGSMGGEKIVLARQAVEHALQLLNAQDHFSLVVFDDVVDVIVASTPATGEARRHALRALARIGARGSTNLAGGWTVGCEQVTAHLTGGAIGRCLLVTDGQANIGESDPEALSALAAATRQRGVATSTFGVGADFDERTLQRMAEGGQGHFYYVAAPQAIPDLLTSELGDSLDIVARDAALVVRAPDGVEVDPIGPFRVAAAGQVVRVEVGDLVSGQALQIVLRLTFGGGAEGDTRSIACSLAAKDDALGGASRQVAWTFADHSRNDAQRRDRVVDRAVAGVDVSLARQEALALNRESRYDDARRVLEQVAARIAAYAGDDAALRRIVWEVREDLAAFAVHMDPVQAKQRHFASYAAQHSRMPDGKTRRR
jgi:Ca-activated chloride channel homolog